MKVSATRTGMQSELHFANSVVGDSVFINAHIPRIQSGTVIEKREMQIEQIDASSCLLAGPNAQDTALQTQARWPDVLAHRRSSWTARAKHRGAGAFARSAAVSDQPQELAHGHQHTKAS